MWQETVVYMRRCAGVGDGDGSVLRRARRSSWRRTRCACRVLARRRRSVARRGDRAHAAQRVGGSSANPHRRRARAAMRVCAAHPRGARRRRAVHRARVGPAAARPSAAAARARRARTTRTRLGRSRDDARRQRRRAGRRSGRRRGSFRGILLRLCRAPRGGRRHRAAATGARCARVARRVLRGLRRRAVDRPLWRHARAGARVGRRAAADGDAAARVQGAALARARQSFAPRAAMVNGQGSPP